MNTDATASSCAPDPHALQALLNAYRQCWSNRIGPAAPGLVPPPPAQALADWLAAIKQPLAEARWSANACDPWDVMGLGRDEVRNSRVLAWILDPRGSHGLGGSALDALFAMVGERLGAAGFGQHSGTASALTGSCRVHTETCVDGDQGNRVDIEIDHDAVYLLIEVKIGAPEGIEQLDRYGRLACRKAGRRPWGLVFLTSHGRVARTAVVHADRVVPMTWDELGQRLDVALSHTIQARRRQKPASPSQTMAEQVVSRFLQRVRKF